MCFEVDGLPVPERRELLERFSPRLPIVKYTLQFNLSRRRWRDTNSTNPESVYLQAQSLELSW
jgi:hypothetical protein